MKKDSRNRVALFCILGLLVVALLLGYVRYRQSQTLVVDVGPYKSQQVEEKAAVQRLSLELTRHPEVNSIRIVASPSPWRQGVMGFIRNGQGVQKNIFWMDDRFSSAAFDVKSRIGIHAEILVSEEPIHEAANHLATFDDVNYYNEQLRLRPLKSASGE